MSFNTNIVEVTVDNISLIHHQGVICCVAFDRFSFRRIAYTPQSALLPHAAAGSAMRRLTSNTLLVSRALQNPLSFVHRQKFDGGFWISQHPQAICFINPKHEFYAKKIRWLKEQFKNGLRIKLLYLEGEKRAIVPNSQKENSMGVPLSCN